MANGEDYLDTIKVQLSQGRKQWKRGDKLLEAFGYTRRRQTAIDLINGLLDSKGMYTDPTLTTEMPLDRAIRFYVKGTDPEQAESPEAGHEEGVPVEVIELADQNNRRDSDESVKITIPQEPPAADPDAGLIVGNLACAEKVPEQIEPSRSVEQALTRMALLDYSQLVVATSLRSIKGLISYKSVAQAYLHLRPTTVNDCLDRTVPIVELTESLLKVVERFQTHSAVLVRRPDGTLAGIVTPSDIAAEFGAMAAPFFIIGQIEDQLRWLVQKSCPDLTGPLAVVGVILDGGRAPSVSDLTMGELHRILDNDQNWRHIGIKFDRAEFCKELSAIREIRNAVMHFRELPSGAVYRLERFATVVQTTYRTLAK